MASQNARESVIEDFKEKLENGLQDVKFFTSDIENITEDHFYEQAHKLNLAIAKGNAKPMSFGDTMLR